MAAITHGKGVPSCEPYEKMDGVYFANFIEGYFEAMFADADKKKTMYLSKMVTFFHLFNPSKAHKTCVL